MRILLWHGYLLGGTGSNVYTRMLAREWSNAGHDVTVLSQEPHPERFDLGSATAVRPDVGGLLPVFVLDRYEGYEVRRVQDCSRAELDAWVEANAAALRALLPADVVFTNHVLLGGPVGAATGAPFAVKAHGSELEYSMRGNPELSAWGAEALAAARATFVGSEHIRTVLARGVRPHRERVRGPARRRHRRMGARAARRRPRRRCSRKRAATRRTRATPRSACPTRATPTGSSASSCTGEPVVVYFGKLIEQKGVHVLIEALAGLDARLVVVGFGPERAALEALAADHGVEALFTGPLEHRHLQAPARARRRLRRAVDLPRGVRHGRGRGRRGRLPAARRPPLGARRGRGRARGGLPAGARATWPRSTRATRRISPAGCGELLALLAGGPRCGPRRRPRRRGRALELGGRLAAPARAVRLSKHVARSRYRKCSIDYAFTLHGRRAARSNRSASPRRPRALRGSHRLHRRSRGRVRAARPRLARPRQPLRGRAGSGRRHGGRELARRRADRVRGRDQDRQGRDVRRRAADRSPSAATSSSRSSSRSASRSAPPAPTRGRTGRTSGSSTRRTTGATTSSSATSSGRTTRSASTSTSGSGAPTARSR